MTPVLWGLLGVIAASWWAFCAWLVAIKGHAAPAITTVIAAAGVAAYMLARGP